MGEFRVAWLVRAVPTILSLNSVCPQAFVYITYLKGQQDWEGDASESKWMLCYKLHTWTELRSFQRLIFVGNEFGCVGGYLIEHFIRMALVIFIEFASWLWPFRELVWLIKAFFLFYKFNILYHWLKQYYYFTKMYQSKWNLLSDMYQCIIVVW